MLKLLTRAQVAQRRIRARLCGEQGQTTSEYMVIAGVVVVILLIIFGTFRTEIIAAMDSLTGNITKAVN
jgi:Flp pilus assembly pilin Flp